MKTGVRGRIAGRKTVGTRQKPHTARSKAQYGDLHDKVWAQIAGQQGK